MYLPRSLLSLLYSALADRTHPLSPPVLLLVALHPDALCAARILTTILKRDYIPHKVQPVAGYSELQAAGQNLVKPLTRQNGGEGGVVVCLGVGGLIDLEEILGLDSREENSRERDHGVEVWVFDARRPWNLQNVFGMGDDKSSTDASEAGKRSKALEKGRIGHGYKAGRGEIIVFDDGDIENELVAEREAFCALAAMPELGDDEDFEGQDEGSDDDTENEESQTTQTGSRKRKSPAAGGEDDLLSQDDIDDRPKRRRRSNSGSASIISPSDEPSQRDMFAISNHPSSSAPHSPIRDNSIDGRNQPTSARTLRRQLLKVRRKHEATLAAYYALGTSYSEPLSSMMYNLAEDLGKEDNDILWLAIVGVSAMELYSQTQQVMTSKKAHSWSNNRQERIRAVLRDEVRRLNPLSPAEITQSLSSSYSAEALPTAGKSPTSNAIRLSPEPRFLLTRHWSLYESMLHSPYLASRLHIWSEAGRKRLDRLLTKMGISLDESKKGYTHMDMELKRTLRPRLLKFAPMYGLDGLVPPQQTSRDKEGWGFVRCWGWRASLSAVDVAVIVGAILEVGSDPGFALTTTSITTKGARDAHRILVSGSYGNRIRGLPTPDSSPNSGGSDDAESTSRILDPDFTTNRFYAAYDALAPGTKSLDGLLKHVDTAKHLHAAILRTGSILMNKHQIRHLRAFRMGVVREGPDVPLFCHPGALVKLAGWVSEAVGVLEAERGAREKGALVLGALDEDRGVYVVVGLGGGGVAGTRVKTRAEIKEREEKKKKKEEEKSTKRLERRIRREERRNKKKEREEANGIFREDEDDNDEDEDEETESESESDDSDSESEDEELLEKRRQRGYGLNKFGSTFQEVVEETNARVRIDSFDHSVVEVKKEDFSGFLEALSLKNCIGK